MFFLLLFFGDSTDSRLFVSSCFKRFRSLFYAPAPEHLFVLQILGDPFRDRRCQGTCELLNDLLLRMVCRVRRLNLGRKVLRQALVVHWAALGGLARASNGPPAVNNVGHIHALGHVRAVELEGAETLRCPRVDHAAESSAEVPGVHMHDLGTCAYAVNSGHSLGVS